MRYTFEEEFRLDHPETVGETDRHFDLNNYKDWLEAQLIEARKQLASCNVSGAIALLKFLKEEQQEYYQKSTGIFDASIHQHYEEALIAVLELINSRFGN